VQLLTCIMQLLPVSPVVWCAVHTSQRGYRELVNEVRNMRVKLAKSMRKLVSFTYLPKL
jgi:hypothetical protein